MRAAVVRRVGSPPEMSELPEPAPEPGEALISVRAAGLNPVEVRVAAGAMPRRPQVPYVPGLEGAGIVVRSQRFPEGTRVRFENDLPGFGKDGSLRETAVAAEDALVELPPAVLDTAAAAAGVVGVTAWLSYRRAALRPGERVVVLGATGGVGQIAVQLARLLGAARVVAVGRHRPTLEWLESAGADAGVEIGDPQDLAARLVEAAGGPVDVVIDPLWGAPAMAAIAALGEEGRLVNVGQSAGTDVELPLAAMRQVRSAVIGMSSGWTPLSDKVEAYRAVVDAVASGDLTVTHETLPLQEVGEAWERQAAHPHTKLVITFR